MSINEILQYNFLHFGSYQLNLSKVLVFIFILFLARVVTGFAIRIIRRYFNHRKIEQGRQYAILQVIKYIFYVSFVYMAFDAIGISLSVIWGGAAALMVGVGLGLQQTFNDLISGLILLVEGSIEVGDNVEVGDIIGTVTEIGIRTSKIETRDRISLIVPNSKLIGENTINWSYTNHPTRFAIKVGVAYSSDIKLVTKLLLQAAAEHPKVLKNPTPSVQFNEFGNSSLDFTLLIFTHELLRIEFLKSDIRYRIIELFREHQIEIPFPQRDLWIRNPETL